jgi:protein ImuA
MSEESGSQCKNKADVVAALKARIRHLEQGDAGTAAAVCPLGLAPIDEALPGGGLTVNGLHEVAGPVEGRGDGAAMGFALALAGRFAIPADADVVRSSGDRRVTIWISPHDDLHPPALHAFGVAACSLIRAKAAGKALLWSVEEAVRSAAAAVVVMECEGLDLTASRRLQLASEAGRTPLVMLRRRLTRSDGGDAGAGPIAAHTRWMATSLHSQPEMTPFGPVPGVGSPVWRLALVRSRGGRAGSWDVVWNGSARRFSLMPKRPAAIPVTPVRVA